MGGNNLRTLVRYLKADPLMSSAALGPVMDRLCNQIVARFLERAHATKADAHRNAHLEGQAQFLIVQTAHRLPLIAYAFCVLLLLRQIT